MLTLYNTYCFSMATMVTRTHLIVSYTYLACLVEVYFKTVTTCIASKARFIENDKLGRIWKKQVVA